MTPQKNEQERGYQMLQVDGGKPIKAWTVTDFPQPDSPTMASVSPASTWNDTSSTARTIAVSVMKCVCRWLTWSSGVLTIGLP